MSDTLTMIDCEGNTLREVEIAPHCLEREKGAQAVHDDVVAHLAAKRTGNASTKTKAEKRGGGEKPWRQKGTGRARAGSTRSPIWRGGGVAFGPRPRDYTKKVNRKVRQLALRRAFAERVDENSVILVDDLTPKTPKTTELKALLNTVGAGHNTLVLGGSEISDNLLLAVRNLPRVTIMEADQVYTYSMLKHRKVLVTEAGLELLSERLKTRVKPKK